MTQRTNPAPAEPRAYDPIDAAWLRRAYQHAQRSPDRSTQNGAVAVVDGTRFLFGACNRPPGPAPYPDAWLERPAKYDYTEHAERALVARAACFGLPLAGVNVYCPWAACMACARALAMARIGTLIVHQPLIERTPPRWRAEVDRGLAFLAEETEVQVVRHHGPIKDAEPIRFNGEIFNPCV